MPVTSKQAARLERNPARVDEHPIAHRLETGEQRHHREGDECRPRQQQPAEARGDSPRDTTGHGDGPVVVIGGLFLLVAMQSATDERKPAPEQRGEHHRDEPRLGHQRPQHHLEAVIDEADERFVRNRRDRQAGQKLEGRHDRRLQAIPKTQPAAAEHGGDHEDVVHGTSVRK